jgi:hypothetical protein
MPPRKGNRSAGGGLFKIAHPTGMSTASVSLAQLAERDEPLAALVPQDQAHASEAFGQREPADGDEFRVIAQNLRQPVVRDSAAQVMDVVHADVGREPPQHGRKVVMRAAVERRLVEAPGPVRGPESILELVLK